MAWRVVEFSPHIGWPLEFPRRAAWARRDTGGGVPIHATIRGAIRPSQDTTQDPSRLTFVWRGPAGPLGQAAPDVAMPSRAGVRAAKNARASELRGAPIAAPAPEAGISLDLCDANVC